MGGRGLLAAVVLVGAIAGAHAETAEAPAHVPMVEVEVTPTRAWVEFCRRLPAECAVDTKEAAMIPLTVETFDLLKRVNREVNVAITPKTDWAHWGVEDRWDFPDDSIGDCEDIQIEKRRRLVAAGLPRRALLMTVVLDEGGDGHAVLMVRTASGDLILDNKKGAVLPWYETGYEYLKREGQESQDWVAIGEPSVPVLVANR
ncbi:MAG TPA: transglutaminase-like cysteine peptidase [Beijerinckiaceae bacterium]